MEYPDVCPMEQSNNRIKHSWHSRKIREFERYTEILRLEVMMAEQELEEISALKQEVVAKIDDLKVCKYHLSQWSFVIAEISLNDFEYVITNMVDMLLQKFSLKC